MKKTLLGVLAFVLVLATVLTGTVLAADDTNKGQPQSVAEVQKVGADNPIKVDGYMDKAYTNATALAINMPSKTSTGTYTHGIARFVWSEQENALYCFMIINDANVGRCKYDTAYQADFPWFGDTVELFLDFIGTTGDYSIIPDTWGLPANTVLTKGLQYRIDGYSGEASCNLQEDYKYFNDNNKFTWRDPASGKAHNACYSTYYWDEEAGAFKNACDSLLTADGRNVFGWAKDEDLTKNGWASKETDFGYTAEFRVEATCISEKLAAGKNIRFDIQINDCWDENRGVTYGNFIFYNSTLREYLKGADSSAADNKNQDWLTLVDTEADNSGDPYSLARLEEYGMADAMVPMATITTPREIIKTDKKTWPRKPTSAVNTNTDTPGNSGDGDNNNNQNDNQGGDDTTGGGCGSSISVGASLAAVSLVAAAGFFAFRKKDEE